VWCALTRFRLRSLESVARPAVPEEPVALPRPVRSRLRRMRRLGRVRLRRRLAGRQKHRRCFGIGVGRSALSTTSEQSKTATQIETGIAPPRQLSLLITDRSPSASEPRASGR
jgi:hypothetical protein